MEKRNVFNKKLPFVLLFILIILNSCVSAKPVNGTKLSSNNFKLQYNLSDAVPLAPELTKKVLPNGLTYYIRRNGNPGGRATMFLLVASGSSNENEDQLGYAHFVEHMAFNGTASFPENHLVEYLRSVGMEFGAEVNAHTTREETLFNLEMPIASKPENLDTGLKVLKEWATAITFDPVEVEKEKGVILEERRSNLSPAEDARVRELEGLLAGTKHSNREPIGTEESIKNATADKLKKFYNDNYRLDRMAVIVVGDINPREVEEKIIKEFSMGASGGEVKEIPIFEVKPTDDMAFVSSFDPSFDQSIITYRKVVPYVPESVIGDYYEMRKLSIASEAIALRLNDLSKTGKVNWIDSYFGNDYFFGQTKIYQFVIAAEPGKELNAFNDLSIELERIRRYGFTQAEFNRLMDLYRNWVKTLDIEDSDVKSTSFAEEYVRNFRYNEPVPGIFIERFYINDCLDTLTLEELNRIAKVILSSDEGCLSIRAKTNPKTNSVITEDAFEKMLMDARKSTKIEAPKNEIKTAGLFDNVPKGGKIITQVKADKNGIEKIVLSNGATVLLKSTNYDNDAISFAAFSDGGYNALPEEMQTLATFLPNLMSVAGLGEMDYQRYNEVSASINGGIQWQISENYDVFAGKTSSNDIENILRIIYLHSVEPGKDKQAFNTVKANYISQLSPILNDPAYQFETGWASDIYGNNPRVNSINIEQFKKITYEDARKLQIETLANASSFTYVFVGDFDMSQMKKLVEKYLGAIPEGSYKEPNVINALSVKEQEAKNYRKDFKTATENRASVRLVWAGHSDWTWQRQETLRLLTASINNRLLDSLREDLGGTYVVSSNSSFSKSPVEQYSLTVKFDTDPARVDEMIEQIKKEIASIAAGKLEKKYVDSIRLSASREYSGRLRTNDYWISMLMDCLITKDDYSKILEKASIIPSLVTEKNFQELAAELLQEDNLFTYVMLPK